jgi:hypothetical protein
VKASADSRRATGGIEARATDGASGPGGNAICSHATAWPRFAQSVSAPRT